MLTVRTFVLGPLQSNCYVVASQESASREAVLVDPGYTDLDPVFDYVAASGLRVTAIWCTHAHADHVAGADVARERLRVNVWLHEADLPLWQNAHVSAKQWFGQAMAPLADPDAYWQEGTSVRVGDEDFTIWHTPGHTPGGVCIIGQEVAFTGDTLFAGTIGRTDLPYSDPEAMMDSLRKLLTLPDELRIYPGHMRPTTMADERRTNPFFGE